MGYILETETHVGEMKLVLSKFYGIFKPASFSLVESNSSEFIFPLGAVHWGRCEYSNCTLPLVI